MGRRSDEVKIFLDVNIFVELFLDQERQEECKDLFDLIKQGEINAYTSDFVVFGSSLILERNGKKPIEIKRFLEDVFNMEGLTVYDLTPGDMIDANERMKKHSLSLEDAFSLQGALTNKIQKFVSFDKHFDDTDKIVRIEPKDVLPPK